MSNPAANNNHTNNNHTRKNRNDLKPDVQNVTDMLTYQTVIASSNEPLLIISELHTIDMIYKRILKGRTEPLTKEELEMIYNSIMMDTELSPETLAIYNHLYKKQSQ